MEVKVLGTGCCKGLKLGMLVLNAPREVAPEGMNDP